MSVCLRPCCENENAEIDFKKITIGVSQISVEREPNAFYRMITTNFDADVEKSVIDLRLWESVVPL